MGPGLPNPMMWGSGDPLDDLARIDRSLRMRESATPYLSWTPPGAGNRTVWTWFGWLKPSFIDEMALFLAGGTSQNFSMLSLAVSGAIRTTTKISDVYSTDYYTPSLFRDNSAHRHVVIARNGSTTHRIWVNGILVGDVPSPSGANSFFNSVTAHYIGRRPFLTNAPIDGELSHCGWVDGQALTGPDFGQLHPKTGQFRPKTKEGIRAAVAAGGGARNGWGGNGFFLTFDDPTSTTTLCYDRSQSDTDTTGNNWTATNISLTPGTTYDSVVDTPTDNYCVLNSLDKHAGIAVTQGGLYAALSTNIAGTGAVRGSIPVSSGKWYWELTVGTIPAGRPYMSVGIAPVSGLNVSAINTFGFGSANESYAYLSSNGNKMTGGVASAYGTAWPTTGVIIGVAMDMDAGTLEFFRNGVSQGVAFTGISGTVAPAVGLYTDPASSPMAMSAYANFGQQPFSYTPPAGFKALSTKNIPFPPAARPGDCFVAKTDSGANIKATLEAASPWDKWIRAYKRLGDVAEGWRWEFWDDPGYYLDTSSQAGKAAFPALAGTSYVGYALKVSPATGIATGTFTHVNGTPSVISDGLSNARKMVALKRVDIGSTSDWPTYHPDLTAGKLLYLNSTAAETTDASISSVTASGFTAAAALPSGTYRWISAAEIVGLVKLFKHAGNGVADGPFDLCRISPLLAMVKRSIGGVGDFNVHDIARSPTNDTADERLRLNTSDVETSAALLDLTSSGVKVRNTTTDYNASGSTYVGLAIAAAPFRYANAR